MYFWALLYVLLYVRHDTHRVLFIHSNSRTPADRGVRCDAKPGRMSVKTITLSKEQAYIQVDWLCAVPLSSTVPWKMEM